MKIIEKVHCGTSIIDIQNQIKNTGDKQLYKRRKYKESPEKRSKTIYTLQYTLYNLHSTIYSKCQESYVKCSTYIANF